VITNVSQHSIEAFHQIAHIIGDQEERVLAVMERGRVYSRRQLGRLAGIENSAAARCVNGLVKAERLIESGTIRCPITGRRVGGVRLGLLEGL
jgi:alkylated DNA nucleotide flippase Atl1